MRIGFIGAGKVATAFGRYLHSKNVTVSGYCDRHSDKVRNACAATLSQAFGDAEQTANGSDLILIATRDDQIAGVCRQLCERQAINPAHLVGHMSGAHSTAILAQAADLGAAVFSLHPLQAFADPDQATADLPKTYFTLEGSDDRLEKVEKLLETLGNPFLRIAPEHKSLYHLAACILSNYLVTLAAYGLEALARSGIAPQHGFQAMLPLIKGTIDNIARIGPQKALTGPIARGDASTIERHLQALADPGVHDLKAFYTRLGLETLQIAERGALRDADKAAALRKILQT